MSSDDPWTFSGLMDAFSDLALAYFLLCISALAFFASKFLALFRVFLPCFCDGIFGYGKGRICWHFLLIELPINKLRHIQFLAWNNFPFNVIRNVVNIYLSYQDGVQHLEGEACSSSVSGSASPLRNYGSDAKGKRIMNRKQNHGLPRERKPALGNGAGSSVPPSGISRTISAATVSADGPQGQQHV